MEDIPGLVKDLALILMVAGVVTLVFKKLKQPLEATARIRICGGGIPCLYPHALHNVCCRPGRH